MRTTTKLLVAVSLVVLAYFLLAGDKQPVEIE